MTMNGAVLPMLALYIVAAEEQGVPPEKLVGHDPERHPQRIHGAQHLHLSARAVAAHHLRHLRLHLGRTCRSSIRSRSPAITCRKPARRRTSSSPIRSPTASNMCAPASRPASTIDQFAPRLSFFWAIGMNFFMEVAKLRAARLLWAKLMKPFNPKDARSLSLRTHCQTSGWSLTAQDVFNNVAAHHDRGDGGDAGPHPVAAHQRARRGAGAADRFLRPHRPQHPDRAAAGKRHHPHRRSVGRLVLCRAADLRARATRPGATSRKSRRSAAWPRRSRPAFRSCASRKPPPRRRRASMPAMQSVIGVNKYQAERRSADRRAQGRQLRGARACRSTSSRGCGASAIRRRSRRRSPRSPAPPTAATATCWRSRSMPRAPRPPSARFRRRWRRSSAAIAPRSRRSPASTSGRSAP